MSHPPQIIDFHLLKHKRWKKLKIVVEIETKEMNIGCKAKHKQTFYAENPA